MPDETYNNDLIKRQGVLADAWKALQRRERHRPSRINS